ncbi:MAG: DUF748 domain-containing protein, partial [Nitrosospira sp.]|nr:DUF748 domain-containing protein [Nitrosospira sp.]
MKKILARAAASKIVWAAAVLLLLYTLGGFLLAPYLLERNLPRYVEDHLGQPASVGDIRVNPYLFILEMSDFKLDGAGDNALLKFERLTVDFELWSSIFRGAWTFADIRTKGFDLRLEIDREGHINVAELLKRLQGPERTDQPPPSIILEHVAVSDSSISFSDFSDATLASTTFAPINLELTGFRTFPDDRKGNYTLALSLPGGASLAWKGDITLSPLTSNGEFSIKGIEVATIWQFLQDELRMAKPQGELALAGRYGFSYGQGHAAFGLSGIQAEVSDLVIALPARSTPLLSLRSIRVSDAQFVLDDRELVVSRLRLSDGKLSASRAGDGTLDWQRLVVTAPRSDEGADAADVTDVAEEAKQPWRVRVENAGMENVALAYADHALSPARVCGAGAVNSQRQLDGTAGAGLARVAAEALQLTV